MYIKHARILMYIYIYIYIYISQISDSTIITSFSNIIYKFFYFFMI
ncbi:MAG: hypothetical protein MCS20_01565 [Candidatus Phytoplasma mali]|nr:hypothetical protein [Candidatus Phytoplasma australiense]MCG7202082.1 hypothetical protein [Candidatus Phytoplasma mali]